MTFYLAQPVIPQTRYVQQDAPQVSDNRWPYPPAQAVTPTRSSASHRQQQQQQQPQYVVSQHNPYEARYVQESTPLAKLITQNYLAIAKQQEKAQQGITYYQHPRIQEYPPTNPALTNQDQESLQREGEPEDYRGETLRYQPISVAPSAVGNDKYQSAPLQYHQEAIFRYQTPAPLTSLAKNRYTEPNVNIQRHKPLPIKQHLTEVTNPHHHVGSHYYNGQEERLREYSVNSNRPSYQPVTANPTEPTVSIMQSHEIEVGTAAPEYQSPIATITPKYQSNLRESQLPKYHAVYLAKSTTSPEPLSYQEQYLYDDEESQLNNIFNGASLSKSLPDRITPENLDSSIKQLSKLLRILQKANAPNSVKEIAKSLPKYVEPGYVTKVRKIPTKRPLVNPEEDGTPGRAGIDYPVHGEIPETSFSCKMQRYKGFFGDPETGCQAWHYCDLNGGQASFLCPNGTIFSQVALTCDWWFNVKCQSTEQLYVLNERLYKYILPHKPSFPEDYAGPLVDQYLTDKFIELEQKNNKTEDASSESTSPDRPIDENDHQFSLDDVESENKVRAASGLS